MLNPDSGSRAQKKKIKKIFLTKPLGADGTEKEREEINAGKQPQTEYIYQGKAIPKI
jgi:hypothetical protein